MSLDTLTPPRPVYSPFKLDSEDLSDSSDLSDRICSAELPQIHFRDCRSAIFRTERGYCGGFVLNQEEENVTVLLTRDFNGQEIHQTIILPIQSYVNGYRKCRKQVFIKTLPNLNKTLLARGYLKAGGKISNSMIAAGISSSSDQKKLVKYPIYKPLTLHDFNHRKTIKLASQLMLKIIKQYLNCQEFNQQQLESAHWLLNTALYIDDYQRIPKDVFVEALMNFCCDYTMLPEGTLIAQPLNYVLDILDIDGIYFRDRYSISFIRTNFEGVSYSTD